MSGLTGRKAWGSDAYQSRDLKAIAARWNARARSWDADLRNSACHLNEDRAYSRFLENAWVLIKRRPAFCARHGVVDLGCGTGLVLAKVISSFAWGIGVDISPDMVRRAAAKRIRGARFIVGNCFELPEICPRAGAVISRGVLLSHYGLEHGRALLKAIRKTLTPDGFLVLDFLNQSAQTQYGHAAEEKTWLTGEHAGSLARSAGFQKVKVIGEKERRVLLLVARV